ncbi:hypothetical protein HDE_01646 [Halotydeus destructor]|nr:hypothetical protein HDE_01646 [Halotydeus destructor]
MKFFKMKNANTLVCFFLVTIGFTAHTFYIVNQFVSFDTVTQVSYLPPKEVKVPKLVFCEPIKDHLLRLSDANAPIERYTPKAILESCHDAVGMIVKVVTDIDDEVTEYLGKENPIEDLPFEFERFTKHDSVCLTLRLKNLSLVRQPTDVNIPMLNRLYEAEINTILSPVVFSNRSSNQVRWKFFAHEPEKKCYGNFDPHITRLAKNPRVLDIGLTFSYTKVELHKSFFWSKCTERANGKFESQAHCYEDCYKTAALKKTGSLPSTLLGEVTDTFNVSQPSCSETIDLKNIRLECKTKCESPDCITEKFVLEQLWEEWYVAEDVVSKTTISLLPPQMPMTSVKEEPKVSIIDFISFLLSAIGFWFAFSPLVYLATSAKVQRAIGQLVLCAGRLQGKLIKPNSDLHETYHVSKV